MTFDTGGKGLRRASCSRFTTPCGFATASRPSEVYSQEADALIVRGIEPEHSLKDTLRFVESAQAPQAETE